MSTTTENCHTWEPPESSFSSKILIFGTGFVALIATPQQLFFADTIKSVAAALIVQISLLTWLWTSRKNPTINWNHLFFAPLALAIFAIVSTTWSPAHTALIEAGRWFLFSLALIVGYNSLRQSDFGAIASTLHWCSLALGIIALLQFWVGLEWFPTAAIPGSTFGNRNFFAEFVAMGIPFSYWVLLRAKSYRAIIIHGISTGIIALSLMSTGARAALLGASASLPILMILTILYYKKNQSATPKIILATGIITTIATIGILGWIPSLNEGVLTENNGRTPIEKMGVRLKSLSKTETYESQSSFDVRVVGWKASLRMIEENPLRGVGAGAWNYNLPIYIPKEYAADVEHIWLAHNEPLQLVSEFGILGWTALAALLWLITRETWRSGRRLAVSHPESTTDDFQKLLVIVSIGILAITSLAGLPLHGAATTYLLAILVTLLLPTSSHNSIQKNSWTPDSSAAKLIPIAAATVATAATAILAFQALRADYYFNKGMQSISIMAKQKANGLQFPAQKQIEAIKDIKTGLSIYPDQGLFLSTVANDIGILRDHESFIWLSRLLKELRPNAPAIRCNLAIAYAEINDIASAKREISDIEASHQDSNCLLFAKFFLASTTNNTDEIIKIGINLARNPKRIDTDAKMRYVFETTIRTAIRTKDLNTAIETLNLRSRLWHDLRASSLYLKGVLLAESNPSKIVTEATEAFISAIEAAKPQEKIQILQRIPVIYQSEVKKQAR